VSGEEPKSIFASRNPRYYFLGQVVSQVGTSMQVVAQSWLVYQLTESPLLLGLVASAPTFAALVFSAPAGVIADRLSARRVLFCAHVLLGLIALVLGLLAAHGSLTAWQLTISALAVGSVNAVIMPTSHVFIAEIAGDTQIRRAVTMSNTVVELAFLIGSAVAGPTIGLIGVSGVILLNSASYVAVLLTLFLIRPADLHRRARTRRGGARPRGAWRYLFSRLDLTLLVVTTAAVSTAGTSLPPLLLLLTKSLHQEAGAYGLFLATLSVGSLLGAWPTWRYQMTLGRLAVSAVIFGVLQTAVAIMPNIPTITLALLPLGVVSLVLRAGVLSLVQLQTDPDFRGRILGVFQLVFRVGMLAGTLLCSWLAGVLGPRRAIGIGGVSVTTSVTVIVAVLTLFGMLSIARGRRRLDVVLAERPKGRHRRRVRQAESAGLRESA
jgi:MFS family permease